MTENPRVMWPSMERERVARFSLVPTEVSLLQAGTMLLVLLVS